MNSVGSGLVLLVSVLCVCVCVFRSDVAAAAICTVEYAASDATKCQSNEHHVRRVLFILLSWTTTTIQRLQLCSAPRSFVLGFFFLSFFRSFVLLVVNDRMYAHVNDIEIFFWLCDGMRCMCFVTTTHGGL